MNTARLNPGIPLLLNGVTKRYGDNTILNELDLHIPSGQFVAVVGRSGGGKVPCCACWQVWKNQTPANCWLARRPRRRSGRHPDDVSGCAPAAVENSD